MRSLTVQNVNHNNDDDRLNLNGAIFTEHPEPKLYWVSLREVGAPTLLRMISGARYSGVPHRVQVRPFTRFAKPKSVI